MMTYPIQRKIPKAAQKLVKEVLDGQPIYYKGFKAVLRNEKKIEDIMGISSLQSIILWYLSRIVLGSKNVDDNKYYILAGETGLHLGNKNNLAGDILIFERTKISIFDEHFFDIPPMINIEIDIEIDNTNFSDFEYVKRKTENLLIFGVLKVFWILTKTKQVIVAEPQKDWLIIDWSKDIEIMNGITFNIPTFLKQEGIQIA